MPDQEWIDEEIERCKRETRRAREDLEDLRLLYRNADGSLTVPAKAGGAAWNRARELTKAVNSRDRKGSRRRRWRGRNDA